MRPTDLINAKLEGADFDRILHAVRTDRKSVSKLPEDQLSLMESMLVEVKAAVKALEEAISNDDLNQVKLTSISLKEIFQMLEDNCDS